MADAATESADAWTTLSKKLKAAAAKRVTPSLSTAGADVSQRDGEAA
jgi:hypothetical protein